MSFTRVKPAGWAFGEILTSAQANTLDTNHANAIDGAGGGSYTPSAVISVLGSGFGACTVDSGASFEWQGTNWPRVASRTVSVPQPLTVIHNESSRFAFDLTGIAWHQTDITTTGEIIVPLERTINGATLTQVDVWIDGNGAGVGHGSLPATLPALRLYSRTLNSDGAGATVATTTDAPASVSAYETAHTVSVSGLSESMDGSKVYYASVTGEAGANAANNALRVIGLVCQFTVTEIRVG